MAKTRTAAAPLLSALVRCTDNPIEDPGEGGRIAFAFHDQQLPEELVDVRAWINADADAPMARWPASKADKLARVFRVEVYAEGAAVPKGALICYPAKVTLNDIDMLQEGGRLIFSAMIPDEERRERKGHSQFEANFIHRADKTMEPFPSKRTAKEATLYTLAIFEEPAEPAPE